MLKIMVLEKSLEIQAIIKEFVDRYCSDKGTEIGVTFFDTVETFLNNHKEYDLAFIDENVDDNAEFNVAVNLRNVNKEIPFALISTSNNFSFNGDEINVVDFLVYPFTYYQFSTLIDRLQMQLVKMDIPDLALMTKQGIRRVPVDQITYIEGTFKHVIYHLVNEEQISVKGTLNEEEKKLTADRFFRLGDILLNLEHVYKVSDYDVYVGNICLSLPQNKKSELLNSILDYMDRG